MIFQVSILVVASLAALAASPVNGKQRLKKQHSTLSEDIQDEEGTKVVNCKNMGTNLNPKLAHKRIYEKLELDRECNQCMLENREIEHSKKLVKKMEMKRLSLERKVLELYSLKQKLSSIACLQRILADKTAEVDKLESAIFALRGEIKDLKEITRQGNFEVKQLEMTKKMIKEMQMKNDNTNQIKGQIVLIEGQLSGFTSNETSVGDALVKMRLEAVKNIELQVLKMRRINKEVELEKREILVKLYAAQAKVSVHSKISELRLANEDLSDEVERLQKSRFDMVEELVYQRWLNACLKAEIIEHQKSSRKTFQKEVHKASDLKPSRIITRYPNTNSTSSYTSSTDSEEIDSSSTIGSFSSSQRSISKDGSSVVSSPNESSIGTPSKTSMLSTKLDGTSSKQNGPVPKELTETMELPNLTKVRRVSFNDAVETVPLAGEKHEFRSSEVSLVESDWSSDSNRRSVDEDDRDVQQVNCIANAGPDGELHSSISNVFPNENNMESIIFIDPHIFGFLFCVFVLLLCLLHLSSMIY